MPEVSIIIPSYNASLTIRETLESVLSQSFQDWECLVVDDCSCDQSYSIILDYSHLDQRFIPLQLTSNSGVSAARNYALDRASGKYIAFLDSDDIWHNNFLEISLKTIADSDGFVYAAYNRFIDIPLRPTFVRQPPNTVTFKNLLYNNHIPLLTALVRKDLIGSLRFLDDRPEDYIFWLQLFKAHPQLTARKASQLPLADYRVSKSQRSSNKLKNIKRAFYCYKKHLKMNLLSSTFRTSIYVLYSLFDYVRQYASVKT